MDFFTRLFDTSDFPPRWNCGNWTAGHGWLHVLSDLGVWSAYFAIPLVLVYFLARRKALPFRGIFALFAAFILLCGLTHLMEAIIFWWPAYRLAGFLKLTTALVSWVTVFSLFRVVPVVLTMRTPDELEREILARQRAEAALQVVNAELEQRVQERTAALTKALADLRDERELLHITLESIGDGVVVTDNQGGVTFLNPVAETLTGWTTAEAKGVPLGRVFHIVNEQTRQPVENPVEKVLSQGRIVGLANHTILIAKDGTERPIDDSAAPIRDANDRVLGAVLVFHDISERRQREELLQRREQQLRLVADSAPVLIAQCDAERRYKFVNRPYAARFGLEPKDVIGKRIRDVVGERAYVLFEERVTEVLAGKSVEFEIEIPYRASGTQVMRCAYVPERDASGSVVGLVAAIVNITDRKRTEEALRHSEERLRLAVEATGLGIFDYSPLTGKLDWSEQCRAIWGLPFDADVSPEVVFAATYPHDRERAKNIAEGSLDPHGPGEFVMEHRVVRPDGSVAWVLVRGKTMFVGANGERRPARSLGTMLDITNRKRAEEQFRAMAENIPQLAWMAKPDGHIYWYNHRWYEYTGTTPASQEGWGWETVHDPDVLPTVLERWKQSLATGEPFDMVFPLKGWDGVFRPFLTRVMPVKDAEGRVLQWFGTNTDITEQQALEKALRESERRLSFVMESMPQKIFTAKPNGDIDYLNPIWTQFTGLSFEQIKNRGWAEFIHPDDAAENVRIWKHSIDTGEPLQFEHRFRRRDGEYRWHLSRVLPMRDETGRVVMWIGANTDVHEQKQAAEDLRMLPAELSEADRRKDEFLATLAHELRNPLAPIRNGLQIMRLSGGNGAAVERARAMMERQLGQMVHIVDDLLDVSRISRGKLELRQERVDLATVLTNAVETSRPIIESGGHELAVSLPPDPVFVSADVTRLAQVFANLLNNAAKYSERGSRIRLTAVRQGDHVLVSVRDTGIGIPPDMLPRIFEMFTQVDRSLERSQGGLGIGLTLVKRLVEMHGGSVEAHSEGHGTGSAFVVRLPLAPPVVEDVVPPIDEAESARAPGRCRVLIADDNEDSATSLAMMLQIMGNDVRTANDGVQAVEAAAAFRPDAILLDIGMPKLNGYEACRRIRAQPWGKKIAIIALTGWGQDEDKRRSREAGFNHHMVKPVDPAALEKILAALRSAKDAPNG